MSRVRLVAALLVASALSACGNQDDVIESEPSDTTSDLSTNPPDVDTDPPVEDTASET